MSTPSRSVVEAGYDAMAQEYLNYMARTEGDPRLRLLEDVQHRLRPGGRIVDLGCGAGEPCTRLLSQRHTVVGVDISRSQLALARRHAPGASLVRSDIAAFRAQTGSLDAVTAFYSMTHVPRDQHGRVLAEIAGWLKDGGLLLLSLSARGETDGVQDDFVGVPMYFSGYGPDVNRRLLAAAGFEILTDEIVQVREPAGQSAFQWVLATVSRTAERS
jgi:predicted TPR repeat methyltransferase